MDVISAGCLCGRVRLRVTGAPHRTGVCHCLDCRKHSGALFAAAAIFPVDAVTVTGETRAFRGRHFCPECGSSVFGITDDEIEVALGSFDHPDQFRPNYELWTRRREAWLPEFDMKHYSGDRSSTAQAED